MIQVGTSLKVIDNSGAKIVNCIRIVSGLQPRYAYVGDILLVSVKSLRKKRRATVKIQTGKMTRALIVRSKKNSNYYFGDNLSFFENAVVLLNLNNKLIGTRVFGLLPRSLRFTRYMRLLSVCSGVRY
jgi:large subunit ribosomal protein L14